MTKSLAKTPSLNRPWAELKPRERDAWIAEALMDYPNAVERSGPMFMWKDEPCWEGGPPLCMPATCPHYSSDIKAAFQVEEALRERGLHLEYANRVEWLIWRGEKRVSIDSRETDFMKMHAAPELRAEAAYLTLTNKWPA